MSDSKKFNAHHAPVGAFASFTLGHPGASGGFGLELGRPAKQHVYVGVESATEAGRFEALPFFEEARNHQQDFVIEGQGDKIVRAPLVPVEWDQIERRFGACVDEWSWGDACFTLYSPTWSIPEPGREGSGALATALIPAVFAEFTVDNRKGARARRMFFGFQPDNERLHIRESWEMTSERIAGLCCGGDYGVATDAPGATTAIHFDVETILGEPDRERFHFGNGTTGILDAVVPAGEILTIPLVLGFHRAGVVTSGFQCSYLYSTFYKDLEEVLRAGLQHFPRYREAAIAQDAAWRANELSDCQQFHLFHAIRSYYGSTQMLEHQGKPLWVVNEGEYRMMNTLDLTVDQLFLEMRQNPWTTRSVLDFAAEHYSYHDQVAFPENAEEQWPGGVSFCHDMGVGNCFSKPGYSSYEIPGLKGCFSYMTYEQLLNWICCASVYVQASGDIEWRQGRLGLFRECLASLLQRDHPDPAKRDGVMSLDSSRTRGGSEITTYDSLDASLGQARRNTYLAVKSWASCIALEKIFRDALETPLADACRDQARRVAATLISGVTSDGTIPAILEPGCESRILPIVEGLAYPLHCGCAEALDPEGEFGPLLEALRNHVLQVIDDGRCLFPDGAWRLSSTSTNSWLSKIYLSQHVCRHILGIRGPEVAAVADDAHRDWLLQPDNAFYAWGDQFYSGVMKGSKYYPRGVTSVLWLDE
jgi:xylan 1,4-beta-xylosidase